MLLAPCIEWQFAEYPELADRIRAAARAGYTAAEFHLWRDKDLAGIGAALDETGVTLTGVCVDPRRSIVDPAERAEMVQAVADTIAATAPLGQPPLIVASCSEPPDQTKAWPVPVTVRSSAMPPAMT